MALVRVSPSRDEFHRHLPHIPGLRSPSYEDYLKHANAEATEYLAQLTENLQRQGIIELAGALSEGLGDYITDDFQKLTGHEPNSYESFARDFAQVFGGIAQS